MNIEELKYQILQQFGFPPTPEQAQALDVFMQFMTDSNPHAVMILRGSAGTGKTSIVFHQFILFLFFSNQTFLWHPSYFS